MSVAQDASSAIKKLAQDAMTELANFLKSNKEFMAGMGVGAALATPAGRAAVKRLGGDAAKIIAYSKTVAGKAYKDAINYAINSKLGKTNLMSNAIEGTGKTGKVSNAALKASATWAAGKILGNYLGYTISEKDTGKKALKIIFSPVFATTDMAKGIVDSAKDSRSKKQESKRETRELQAAVGEIIQEGVNEAARAETDRKAKELNMSPRPENPTAQTEWSKEVERMSKLKGNHPIWYGKLPEIISSNLNWGVIKQNDDRMSVAIGNKVAVALTVPHKDGAVQQAYKDRITAIFVKMRGSNSGAYNYNSEDVAAYIECVRGIRALLKNLQRDVKLTNMSKVYIAKSPDVFLQVAGYSAANISVIKRDRIAYCDALNLLAATIEDRFPLPPELTVINRSDYVAEYVLTEGRGAKSSVYMYSIDRVLSPNGSNDQKLKLVDTADDSLSDRIDILQTLVDAMSTYSNPTYGPDTFTKIAGDLIKAYGEKSLCKYARVSINDTIEPVFDEYLLHQLQNTCSPQIDRTAINMTAASVFNNAITMTARIPGDNTHTVPVKMVYGLVDSTDASRDVVMNTNKNQISDNEVLSLTRSVAFWKVDATAVNYNTAFTAALHDCGTDVILGMDTYFYASNGNISKLAMLSAGNSTIAGNVGLLEMWSQMDYYPCLQVFNDGNNTGDYSMMLDLDNYAYMTRTQFKAFNDAACASLYTTIRITEQANFKMAKRK